MKRKTSQKAGMGTLISALTCYPIDANPHKTCSGGGLLEDYPKNHILELRLSTLQPELNASSICLPLRLATGDCCRALRWSENHRRCRGNRLLCVRIAVTKSGRWLAPFFKTHPTNLLRVLCSHDLATDGLRSREPAAPGGYRAYFGVRQLSNCLDDAPQNSAGA